MKKSIVLIGVLSLCANAYSQQEASWLTANNETVAEAWGWNGEGWRIEKVEVPGGTLIAESENVTVKTTFSDDAAATNINKLGLISYSVDGVSYDSTDPANNVFQGVVGNTNGKGINLHNPQNIVGGWIFDYYVKETGYLTLITAASLNKNLYVIDGLFSGEEISIDGAMAYDFYCVTKSEPEGLNGTQFEFKLPSDSYGYIDPSELDKYVDSKGNILWPYRILAGDPDATSDDTYPNMNAAVIFPVVSDSHYFVFAQGSKLTAGPYVFTKEYPTQLSFTKATEEGDIVYNLIGGGSGVDSAVVEDANAPIYNMLGVRVNSDAKGILLQNGKKFIRK